MAEKLTDTLVKNLPTPDKGNRITYDNAVKGFGVRVTAGGSRSFILNYRTRTGRERRYTIGSYPDWKTGPARTEAGELKKRVDRGEDPMGEIEAGRAAPTVLDLCQRYEDESLPKKRPASQRNDKAMIKREIKPALKHLKVSEVRFADVDDLHRKITKRGAPIVANRVVALLSKMFTLSIRWGWRADNPAKGVERNQEQKRHRYLSADEMAALTKALTEHDDQQAANIIRLLLLTGARRGEVQAMRWDALDLTDGVWTKPGSTTKQKTMHRVPLSAPARQLLSELRGKADDDAEYVFPSRMGGHRVELKKNWAALRKAAGIPDVRMHDLRHTYASVLASAGMSLPIIGALLGHSQPATTARYAHLFDDPLRKATDTVGAIVTGTDKSAEVVPLKGGAS